MKTNLIRLFLACAAVFIVLSPNAFAQRQLGKKKGPTGKLYIADTKGDVQIQTSDKIYTARQASAFDAPGTVIETKSNSSTAFVYSNGVGMTVGQNSRVEINRFEQAPFTAGRNVGADTLAEPSSSQSDIHLERGTLGITTSELASGSTMLCSTPLASVNVRGGNIKIETTDDETIISLLDGAATVISGDKASDTTVLQPGQQIVIRRASVGRPPLVFINQIPTEQLPGLNDFVSVASNARRTVTFEVIERRAVLGLDAPPPAPVTASTKSTADSTASPDSAAQSSSSAQDSAAGSDASTQEIVAKPTVPAQLPTNVVVSPDRLPGS